MLAVRSRGHEEPGEVRLIELDAGEVVRLEVGSAMSRLGLDDLGSVEPDHVAVAVQLDSHAGGLRGGGCPILRRHNIHARVDFGADVRGLGWIVRGRDGKRDSLSDPGNEVVVAEYGVAHQATSSCRGMTCRRPAS